jgi:hypothetical protein
MAGMTMPSRFQSVVDAQVRAAEARGAFDNLPGAGKPIPGLDEPDDPMWWLKGFIQRENVPTEMLLPPGLAMRREIEKLPETLGALRSEKAVREHLTDLNTRIRRWIQIPVGPQVPLREVDVDEQVAAWQQRRETARARRLEEARRRVPAPPPEQERRAGFWRRLFRAA